MGKIVKRQTGLETVGDLVAALEKYPQDMPLDVGHLDSLHVYQVKPESGEDFLDPRGYVVVEGDDGVFD